MSVYTVHIAEADLDRPLASGRAVYVRDGFSWAAFLFAPLWCVLRRSWLGLGLWLLAVAAILGLGQYFRIDEIAQTAALFVVHLIFGWEAAQLRRRSLRRRGYALFDLISADRQSDAELVFITRITSETGAVSATAPASRPRPLTSSDTWGLAPLGGGA